MASLLPIGNLIIRLDEIDSTNSFLLQDRRHLAQHGAVAIAKSQTKGRGRVGRQYFALPEKNLTCSVVLHSFLSCNEIGLYSLLAGNAVFRTLRPLTKSTIRLKWPNDVLLNKKKVCGILVEIAHLPEKGNLVLVVGIGINCLGKIEDYPSDLQQLLTTLEEESHQKINVESVFQKLLENLDIVLQELASNGGEKLLREWLTHSNAEGAAVKYESLLGWKHGVIEGLTNSGYLLIRNEIGNLYTHISGDVIYCESPYGPSFKNQSYNI